MAAGLAGLALTAAGPRDEATATPQERGIPRVFDEEALRDFELPLADADFEVEHITPEYYYALPERVIHKAYPVYAPGREPPGYLDSLRTLEPAVALDTDTIDTDEEWIRAGELVFDAPQLYLSLQAPFQPEHLAATGTPADADGIYPFQRYVVLAKGDVRMGTVSCGNCHTRVMEDGPVVKGGQGNFPVNELIAGVLDNIARRGVQPPLPITREQFRAPWIEHWSQTMLDTVEAATMASLSRAIPPGVHTRQGTSPTYPSSIPDIRGVRERRFFDATGIMQQRSIGDLMRYAAFNQFVDHLSRYDGWAPSLGERPLPPPDSVRSLANGPFTRFTDAQAYALARYLYSLEPLPSPHRVDEETMALGERVFIEEGCVSCHTPPHYTNDELTPPTASSHPRTTTTAIRSSTSPWGPIRGSPSTRGAERATT
jgi:mono/diheme cytochrome c family protein